MRFILFGFLAVLIHAEDAVPPIEADIVYSHEGKRDLRLDIQSPVSPKGMTPVLVWIHGGGWKTGDRRDVREGMRGFAKIGYTSISIEYRLSDEAIYPAQLNDTCAALRWIASQAELRALDIRRTALIGISAGGHLALLTGFHGRTPVGMQIKAIVNMAGPTCLSIPLSFQSGDTAPNSNPSATNPSQLVSAFLGSSNPADKVYGEASPLKWVRQGVPPVLSIHGRTDKTVSPMHSLALHAALRAVGVHEKLILLDGGHDLDGNAEQANAAVVEIVNFIASNL